MGALAAISAAKSNKFFKAKRMRDDLVFDKNMNESEQVPDNKTSKMIFYALNSMEAS